MKRQTVAALTLSAAGLVGLVVNEGYRGEAYTPIEGDRATIGYGSTEGVEPDDTTNPVEALARMQQELAARYEPALRRCVNVPLSQAEYDVYVDLLYNIGPGASGVADGFCEQRSGGPSTIVRRLNRYDYTGACDAILMWRYAAGRDCSIRANGCYGVWARRLEAHERCLGAQAL